MMHRFRELTFKINLSIEVYSVCRYLEVEEKEYVNSVEILNFYCILFNVDHKLFILHVRN